MFGQIFCCLRRYGTKVIKAAFDIVTDQLFIIAPGIHTDKSIIGFF